MIETNLDSTQPNKDVAWAKSLVSIPSFKTLGSNKLRQIVSPWFQILTSLKSSWENCKRKIKRKLYTWEN